MSLNIMQNMRDIWEAILADKAVLAGMGLSGATQVEIRNTIIKRKMPPDQIANDQRRLAIYFVPSRPGSLEITSELVLQIDCHIPSGVAGCMDVAHQVLVDCWKAVKGKNLGGVQLHFDGILGDLYSAPSHYSAGMRLIYHSVVY